MSEMEKNESWERTREGLKRAASCAKQMAKAQNSMAWLKLANQLDKTLKGATELYEAPAITQQEAEMMIDNLVARKVIAEQPKATQ